ncbi:BAG domain-containing protein Samui [Eufriesea mexicana]|nr:BAG domain-containing protein Samui [Eufriesea mexicana]
MDSPVIVDKASEFGESIDLDRPFPVFPFDDDNFGRRSDIRAHLDNLAARHPEFADHLLGPPWGDIPFHGSFRNRNRDSGNGGRNNPQQGYSDEDARSQASGSSAASGTSVSSSHGESDVNQNQQNKSSNFEQSNRKGQIPQYGLRNTVDIGQHHHNMENPDRGNRGQRSMSAPPENRQSFNQHQPQQQEQQSEQQSPQQPQGQRYVSRIDITPQHNQPQQQQKVQQQQQQQQQQSQQQPQAQQKSQQQGNVRHIPIFVEGRDEPVFPRSFDEPSTFRREPSPTQFHSPPHFQRPSPFGQHFSGRHHQWPPQFEDQFYQSPKVDSLAEQVKQYHGNSRTDKEYIYLDEMLTRELIKLDDIETEGRDNVRQARRNAIKSIQETISLLESKAPLPSQQPSSQEHEKQEDQVSNVTKEAERTESMDVDQKSEDQSQNKEAIPLPPGPSSPTKKSEEIAPSTEKIESIGNDNVPTNQQQEPSQTVGNPMDTTPAEKQETPTMGAQQNSEEANVTEQKKLENVPVEKQENTTEEKQIDVSAEKCTDNVPVNEGKIENASEKVPEEKKTENTWKKTKKQGPVSDKPIPLPAPENTEASAK